VLKKDKKPKLSRKKTLSIIMATVNSFNTLAPLTLPLAAVIPEIPKARRDTVDAYMTTSFNRGGQLLDHLFFSTVYAAYTTPVTSGITVTGEIIEGGTQEVQSGGSTTSTTVNNAGLQWVSGGSATVTTINFGGLQQVQSGGSATSTTVNSGGMQRLVSGGSATSTTVDSGTQQLLSGGSATITTVNSGGLQVLNGGSATSTTVNSGGTQRLVSGGSATNTTINGGLQVISGTIIVSSWMLSGGSATITTVNSGGTQQVLGSGSATSTTVNSGGTQQVLSSGSATITTVNSGGTQEVLSGGSATVTTINGGIQQVFSGGSVTITTVNSGGTQEVQSGGSATSTTINGGLQLLSGGSATSTTLNGGTQQVQSGGSATSTTVNSGGLQQVLSGGSATSTTLNSGGLQQVLSGGSATSTTLNGGTQQVQSGGSATSTTVNSGGLQQVLSGGSATVTTVNSGGQQQINSGGTSTDTTIAGGTLQIESGAAVFGTTTMSFGEIALIGSGSYNITGLVVSGGSVRLAYGTTVGRNLTLASLKGSTNFIINTNLASGLADKLTVTSVSGTSANTVQVAYDPVYATGNSLTGSALFATVPSGVSFIGRSSEYGAYTYTPTVSADSTGASWSVTALTIGGSVPSETVRTGSDLIASNLYSWRNETNSLLKRMGELRDVQGESGFWLRSYAGEQTVASDNRSMRQQYTAIQGGYDKRIEQKDGVWYLGGTLGYREDRNTFNRGRGNSSDFSLGAYGSWLGKKGHFVDIIARVGKFRSNYTSYLNNSANTAVDGNYESWGQSLSMEYGWRKQLKNKWYLEPQAELTYSRLNGADYITSDGTNVHNDAANSLVARLGLAVGRHVGSTHYYGKVSVAREFSANSTITAFNGSLAPVVTQQDLKENWLEFTLGVTTVLNKKVNGYLEVTQTTGDKVRTPWQVNVGARWSF